MIECTSRSYSTMKLLGPAMYWEHSVRDHVDEQATRSPSTTDDRRLH